MDGLVIYDVRTGSKGLFSEVFLASRNGVACLAKVSPRKHHGIFKNEVKVLRRLANAPHFPEFLDALAGDTELVILMSDCGKDLDCTSSPLSLPLMLDHISRGLETLHEMSMVHCDVKPSNITVKNNTYFLVDLGFCSPQKLHYTPRGSLNYCSVYAQITGRVRPIDDLISLVHVALKKQANRLPWSHFKKEADIVFMKRRFSAPFFTEEWAPYTRSVFQLYSSCIRQHQRLSGGEQVKVDYTHFRIQNN